MATDTKDRAVDTGPQGIPTFDPVSAASTPTTSTATTAPPLSDAQKSARAIIVGTLDQYGLGSLADKAWGWFLNGMPTNQIMLEIRSTPEYQTRFPAMGALAEKGRAISEQQYIDYERTAAQLFRQAGLPSGFYDSPEDFSKLIAGEVSTKELADRVQHAADAVNAEPPEFLAEQQRLYHLTPGDLTAVWLNPDKAEPLLVKQFQASEHAASAVRTGFGELSQAQAEGLATSGVSQQAGQAGFSQLASMHELMNALPGENVAPISTDDQIAAQFAGNASAQERIRRRAAQRAAAFQGGGGYGATSQGVGGLGPATT